MKICSKNKKLRVSEVSIGMVLTFKGLNELKKIKGNYFDKISKKAPLFAIGPIGEGFFDKKFKRL